ncbi:cytochrome-c peroxidase [Aquirhabdus parva]|uniref:Cytochrome-c peroxidase n=1 Tax=Aquirhabdus parva TaxID=2283318 RepID=A0A345P5Q1_9GAMM|nr:cytochrome c peroxidase [Aquirhabdus parva]AXI02610.1 cytochrome-c peroxidase [Aquirhabdus parva]
MPEYSLSNPIKQPILRIRIITMACILVLLSACGSNKQEDSQQNKIKVNYDPYTSTPLSTRAEMGRKLFFEPALSASGKISCASCHNPSYAFGPPNALAVQLGGKDLHLQGIRAAPNLTYAKEAPQFAIGPSDDDHPRVITVNNNHSKLLTPHGGLFWDGRASSLKQQAIGPLMNPLEMANSSKKELIQSIKKLNYFNDLKKLIDPQKIANDDLFLSEVMFLIARYQSEDRVFSAYNSKYDLYLQQKVKLTDAEKRGLALFDDPKKGNCAACHLDKPRADGRPPLFTDYEYVALGVPRNFEIKANNNPAFFDLGICGPGRTDIYVTQSSNCGLFRTPTLRNVALRKAFFHNGKYHSLKDVINFYVNRDTRPERVYPKRADGTVDKFNDLPAKYQNNINFSDAPFTKTVGSLPVLSDADVQDLITFLGTLTDGYQSKANP